MGETLKVKMETTVVEKLFETANAQHVFATEPDAELRVRRNWPKRVEVDLAVDLTGDEVASNRTALRDVVHPIADFRSDMVKQVATVEHLQFSVENTIFL